jgi:hypothetical protein
MVFGPIVIYEKFKDILIHPDAKDFFIRLKLLIIGILKSGFWALVLEFMQHLFYINPIIQNEYQVRFFLTNKKKIISFSILATP